METAPQTHLQKKRKKASKKNSHDQLISTLVEIEGSGDMEIYLVIK
tara:strand:+ start:1500 stop:1637 length:138 start_codon:yes stop_codon:yes gene_type:complete